MITDNPITSKRQDPLGRNKYASEIASRILAYSSEESLVIGLIGGWGSGKTSILNMVQEALNEDQQNERLIKIVFNPWYFADQGSLIEQFFSTIVNSLRNEADEKTLYNKKLNEAGVAIEKYSKMLSPLFLLTGTGPVLEIIKSIGVSIKTENSEKISLENAKNNINNDLSESKSKLLIIIDDIDRMNDIETRQIFRMVKQLADFKNTIYLGFL